MKPTNGYLFPIFSYFGPVAHRLQRFSPSHVYQRDQVKQRGMNFDAQVFDGGLAGSEAARQLAEAGFRLANEANRKKAYTNQPRRCLRERLTRGSSIAGSIESAA